jgi:hypothetical protein
MVRPNSTTCKNHDSHLEGSSGGSLEAYAASHLQNLKANTRSVTSDISSLGQSCNRVREVVVLEKWRTHLVGGLTVFKCRGLQLDQTLTLDHFVSAKYERVNKGNAGVR